MLSLILKSNLTKISLNNFSLLNVPIKRSLTTNIIKISKITKNEVIKNIIIKRKINTVETTRSPIKIKNTNWKDLKNIFALAGPYKWRLIIGLSLLGVSSTIFLSAPRILGKLIDQYDENKAKHIDNNELTTRMANFFKEKPYYLIGVFIVGAVAIASRAYCMHTAGQLIINDLRTNVFKSVLYQDMKFFDNNKVGEIVSRLSSDALITGYSVSMNLSDGARALITMLGSGSLMVYTSPELCKLVSMVIPMILGTFFVFGKLQRRYTKEMQEAVAGANMVATERLSNIRTVRMLAAEEKELNAYKSKINDIWGVAKKEGLAKGGMYGAFQFTGYMSLTTVVFYGSSLISQGLLTYGDLSSFMLYAILCASSLSNMSGFFVEIMKGLGASTRLFELQNSKPTIPISGGLKIKDVHKKISFQNVSFCYSDREPIFHDVTFTMDCGKVTALVGASGSGKSTVLSLLMRFYDPTTGNIYIDDHNLKDIDISYWRSHIGSVGQEPVLFNTTIRDNITYGAKVDDNVTDERIRLAAEQSNALHFIERFPKKFDTMVGELSSSMLSGGEKQRISLSRALVLNPKVLILDEATSALDAQSEYMVRRALDKLIKERKQTILIIAHRLGTIKHADKIVVLDKGRIAEQGTYDELISIKDGVFKNLVDKQQIGWTNETF
uniref:ATP-binding cassette sub-family B member 10, mitochondrial n=1 Tax=Parastrongyloides trichosuri TaxID=131310 RepID=A0A0N4ZQG9_PARTI